MTLLSSGKEGLHLQYSSQTFCQCFNDVFCVHRFSMSPWPVVQSQFRVPLLTILVIASSNGTSVQMASIKSCLCKLYVLNCPHNVDVGVHDMATRGIKLKVTSLYLKLDWIAMSMACYFQIT